MKLDHLVNLRTYARGRACQVRLPGCDGGGETTVLAHYRLIGISGMGIKSPDVIAAHACARCHDLIDGRAHVAILTRADVRLAHAEGMMRTLEILVKDEVLRW